MTEKLYETYLGDGVYASFDGWQVWLRGNADYRENRIALEPEVMGALLAYWRAIATNQPKKDNEG